MKKTKKKQKQKQTQIRVEETTNLLEKKKPKSEKENDGISNFKPEIYSCLETISCTPSSVSASFGLLR